MSISLISLSVPANPQSLSSTRFLSGEPIWNLLFPLTTKLSHLSLKTTPIRMGGGPRTYPGGVSKWQWKRMQAKKAKQLLKARLARERQIYEMRKRAELKAAVSELERPWEAVEKPPNLFSVSADEQLKVLADRFQKPGGLDMWTDRDGPELFRPDNNLPSSRFFPKGVVHSIKPYRKTEKLDGNLEEFEDFDVEEDSDLGLGLVGENVDEMGLGRKGHLGNSRNNGIGMRRGGNVRGMDMRSKDGLAKEGENRNLNGKFRNKGTRRGHMSDSEGMSSGNAGFLGTNFEEFQCLEEDSDSVRVRESVGEMGLERKGYLGNSRRSQGGMSKGGNVRGREIRSSRGGMSKGGNVRGREIRNKDGLAKEGENENLSGKFRKKGSRRLNVSDSEVTSSGNAGFYDRDDRKSRHSSTGSSREFRRSTTLKKAQNVNSDVFDMNLQNDGSYGFEL